MNEIKILEPRISNYAKQTIKDIEFMTDDEIIENCTLRNTILINNCTEYLTIKNSYVESVRFNGSELRNIDASDCIFYKCDFSNVYLSEGIFHRAKFIECKMIGSILAGASLQHVEFRECNLDYSSFKFSRIKKIEFNHCSLVNTDLGSSELGQIIFNESNLQEAEFSGCNLSGIDFTTCNIEGIIVRIDDLNNAIVTAEQAVELAKLMGIKVVR